ncbi:peptidyl-glycine alpha-amidating monooxygenase [Protopterus annectens]|uniref:peptidyl-glycine alpha-amidating monooxygenase n=1 Tax=Protopterus annectens TaxID=7888 RepID=UPI001CFBDED2|nr:peptidyl-glycine alpha-amidating monooxygenase [Protopterus annectens]
MACHIYSLVLLFLIFQNSCLSFRSPLSVFKRYQETARASSSDCSRPRQQILSVDGTDFSLDIQMPGITPEKSDSYFCMPVKVPFEEEMYVVDFKPRASMDTVHHMLLFGCGAPASSDSFWFCDDFCCMHRCNILLAWPRRNPPIRLPTDVGFRVGGKSGIRYFLLQVHYGDVNAFRDQHKDCSGVTLRMTSKKQPLLAGIYLLMALDTIIPPGKKVVNADLACAYQNYPLYPFAYRVHTHHLGQVVSGYRVRDGKWDLIGRQSPQLPQAFYPVENELQVEDSDILAARCMFTGKDKTTSTHIGSTSKDEMCNFYIMYYMEAKHAIPYMSCTDDGMPELFRSIPEEANIPIPVKPDMMHGHHGDMKDTDDSSVLQQPKREEEEVLDQGDFYGLLSKLLGEREDVVHVHKYNPTEKADSDLIANIANIVQKKDLAWSDPREFAGQDERAATVLVRDRVHKFHRLESTLRPPGTGLFSSQQLYPGWGNREREIQGGFHLEEAIEWPGSKLQLGQVSGLALDSKNNLVIFHRGDHEWDSNSFDRQYVYQQRGIGPIEQSTILVVDPVDGTVLKSSGKNLFYLPHGLTTDKDDHYWVTDVALHQVFKLGSGNEEAPLLTLGKAFQPGSDKSHFCQPTDVAVDPVSGAVFVSDGYCNSRILKFSPSGDFVMQWGEDTPFFGIAKPGQFRVPHSLALAPSLGQLCVADRENGRIQCFKAETGEFLREIKHKEFGAMVFAVAYTQDHGGLLYAVNGVPLIKSTTPVMGFAMNFSNGEIIDAFRPVTKGFIMPHDIVAANDDVVYVGDAHADVVWKFTNAGRVEHRSVKKAGIEVQEIEETETILQTRVKSKPASTEAVQLEEPKMKDAVKQTASGVSPVLITTLLAVPIVVLIAIAVFLRWRKTRHYGDIDSKLDSSSAGILGKLRGKGSRGLNLGNFFASHKGYSRKGFDRLSTEGSDQEKDDEDATDSEEEYPVPMPTSSSS